NIKLAISIRPAPWLKPEFHVFMWSSFIALAQGSRPPTVEPSIARWGTLGWAEQGRGAKHLDRRGRRGWRNTRERTTSLGCSPSLVSRSASKSEESDATQPIQ